MDPIKYIAMGLKISTKRLFTNQNLIKYKDSKNCLNQLLIYIGDLFYSNVFI